MVNVGGSSWGYFRNGFGIFDERRQHSPVLTSLVYLQLCDLGKLQFLCTMIHENLTHKVAQGLTKKGNTTYLIQCLFYYQLALLMNCFVLNINNITKKNRNKKMPQVMLIHSLH